MRIKTKRHTRPLICECWIPYDGRQNMWRDVRSVAFAIICVVDIHESYEPKWNEIEYFYVLMRMWQVQDSIDWHNENGKGERDSNEESWHANCSLAVSFIRSIQSCLLLQLNCGRPSTTQTHHNLSLSRVDAIFALKYNLFDRNVSGCAARRWENEHKFKIST